MSDKMISGKHIRQQLKKDLIGKDSHRGVTFSYSWLANQLGHFSLGYFPAFALYVALYKFTLFSNLELIAPLIIAISWTLFEIYNLTKPLLFSKMKASKAYNFTPKWGNLIYDTSTDVLFFILGAFLFKLTVDFDYTTLFFWLALLSVLVFVMGRHWYKTKMYQQHAWYPLQFRLSQWNNDISDKDKAIVKDFVANINNKKHLVIFGSKRSGKTNLGVGIANELSIKHKACTYTTAMKLISMLYDKNDKTDLIWTWREAQVLVIDDINPGDPVEDELISPEKILEHIEKANKELEKPLPSILNGKVLADKSVIWIVGAIDEDKSLFDSWKNMLIDIDVKIENICSINLLNSEDQDNQTQHV